MGLDLLPSCHDVRRVWSGRMYRFVFYPLYIVSYAGLHAAGTVQSDNRRNRSSTSTAHVAAPTEPAIAQLIALRRLPTQTSPRPSSPRRLVFPHVTQPLRSRRQLFPPVPAWICDCRSLAICRSPKSPLRGRTSPIVLGLLSYLAPAIKGPARPSGAPPRADPSAGRRASRRAFSVHWRSG